MTRECPFAEQKMSAKQTKGCPFLEEKVAHESVTEGSNSQNLLIFILKSGRVSL